MPHRHTKERKGDYPRNTVVVQITCIILCLERHVFRDARPVILRHRRGKWVRISQNLFFHCRSVPPCSLRSHVSVLTTNCDITFVFTPDVSCAARANLEPKQERRAVEEHHRVHEEAASGKQSLPRTNTGEPPFSPQKHGCATSLLTTAGGVGNILARCGDALGWWYTVFNRTTTAHGSDLLR